MSDLVVVHHALPDVLLTPPSVQHPRTSKGVSVPDHAADEGMLVLVHAGLGAGAGGEVGLDGAARAAWAGSPGVQHAARWFGEARGSLLYVRADACARLPDALPVRGRRRA